MARHPVQHRQILWAYGVPGNCWCPVLELGTEWSVTRRRWIRTAWCWCPLCHVAFGVKDDSWKLICVPYRKRSKEHPT